ncbi:acyl-CoA dehydrogenase NM domain-like protein [Nadsonia fulvescens var. elongata DSM 6958]|uniref:Acyl-CoA dehydrogenase NM domain-like protein n=1 Tax=Nadsonia fulvescens var. elongata DSM 6958 TaxID=857566 RepID=A0A1E3PQ18_9ASCO|nr:acyl-CoA dehydrogenase NM domain-like protein [Nadsonia fulvescens var. elongata DSM 6958]
MTSDSKPKTFTLEEVSTHNSSESLWIAIDGEVFDVTEFQSTHPGGKKILQKVAGKDATKFFHKYHDVEKVMGQVGFKFKIGSLESNATSGNLGPNHTVSETPSIQTSSTLALRSSPFTSVLAEVKNSALEESETLFEPFGDNVPYADPSWYQGYHSPYYKASHAALRKEVRDWVEEKLMPFVDSWDEEKTVPAEIYKEMGVRGYLAGCIGVSYPKEYTNKRVKSVPVEEWDAFHELIITDEITRAGSGGLIWNLLGGYGIGSPPVIQFGKEALKKRILPGIFAGEKRICLCITEPDAGSDVANLTTTAEKTSDGKYYIVNGIKKWITNGIWADYFTVAVRTGEEGMDGISVLLIEKTFPGVKVRRMDTQGMLSSGSTYIEFDDVKVPVENLLGKENKGFKVVMNNFNHERIGIIIQAIRLSRVCYEESIKYAHKRETFGKKLIDHAVIRNKLAQMSIRIEATYAWLENLVYQCEKMDQTEAMLRLGGAIAGCKAMATQTFEMCAREASQIFGGLAYTRGGKGGKVERLYREVRAYAIPGGSEEIMLDLAIRQSVKVHKFLGAKL